MINMQGGASDCRNRTLHHLFSLVNTGKLASRLIKTELEMDWAVVASVNSTDASGISSPISSPVSSPMDLLSTEEKILRQLRENPLCSTQQLGDALGISKRAVLKHVEKPKQQERLAHIGLAKGGHWQVLE
jgi:ATP-dependent DNA helicase RecG